MRGFWEYKASACTLIAANVLPLLGVLFLGWDTFEIVALYWVENVIIGVINVLKMITCSPDPAEIEKSRTKPGARINADELRSALKELHDYCTQAQLAHHGAKLFIVPFFVFHYGVFCLVHGAFVMAFFAGESFGGSPMDIWHGLMGMAMDRHLGWAVAGLVGSHVYSFFRNYLGGGEYRRTIVTALMSGTDIGPHAARSTSPAAVIQGGASWSVESCYRNTLPPSNALGVIRRRKLDSPTIAGTASSISKCTVACGALRVVESTRAA